MLVGKRQHRAGMTPRDRHAIVAVAAAKHAGERNAAPGSRRHDETVSRFQSRIGEREAAET